MNGDPMPKALHGNGCADKTKARAQAKVRLKIAATVEAMGAEYREWLTELNGGSKRTMNGSLVPYSNSLDQQGQALHIPV